MIDTLDQEYTIIRQMQVANFNMIVIKQNSRARQRVVVEYGRYENVKVAY